MRTQVAACLAAALTFGAAAESVAAKVAKVDLTGYLDGSPQIGDFKIYDRSDAKTLESQVIDLVELKKSTEYLYEITEAGNVEREVGETVHGKEARTGSVFFPDANPPFAFVVAHPKRVQSFFVVPGKPQKFKIGLAVISQGQRFGKAVLAGATTFVGFEPPPVIPDFNPSQELLAHLHREETLTVKLGGSVFLTVQESDSWISPSLGTVLMTRKGQTYQDGVPGDAIGPYTYTFDNGVYHGVPYAMPVAP
ncbi:MAG: hypothetical protein ACHQ6T_15560 [Myxococcota bacterium]